MEPLSFAWPILLQHREFAKASYTTLARYLITFLSTKLPAFFFPHISPGDQFEGDRSSYENWSQRDPDPTRCTIDPLAFTLREPLNKLFRRQLLYANSALWIVSANDAQMRGFTISDPAIMRCVAIFFVTVLGLVRGKGVETGGGGRGTHDHYLEEATRVSARAHVRTLHRVQTVAFVEIYRRPQQTYRGVTLADDLAGQGEGAYEVLLLLHHILRFLDRHLLVVLGRLLELPPLVNRGHLCTTIRE